MVTQRDRMRTFSEKRGEEGREGIADYVWLKSSGEKIIENSLMFLSTAVKEE